MVKASYNLTPFTESDHSSAPSFDDPFFSTMRYTRFLERMFDVSAEHHVILTNLTRTIGLWEGGHEPSIAVNAEGSLKDIEKVGSLMLSEFDQNAVRVLTFFPEAEHSRYVFQNRHQNPSTVIQKLVEAGVCGGHLTQEEIRLDETQKLDNSMLETLMSMFGQVSSMPCRIHRILN
jgi:hypothetical protein